MLKTLDEREFCVACCDSLTFNDIHDHEGQTINDLITCLGNISKHFHLLKVCKRTINFIDRGGLYKPAKEFVERLCSIYIFVANALPKLHNSKKLLSDLVGFLVPYVSTCPTFLCNRGKSLPDPHKHNEMLVASLLLKFISPILANYAQRETDQQSNPTTISNDKINNRKYLTFSK